ncbi:FIVAR domain-containing protein [Pseudoflavonifractor capillosus]|uniref:LPXTG cell wall anchor domain-containing protein n=1 Tax=Pseudoflavonifractor capillosus TaxID=106588 RepID=UPI00195D2D4D|nr:LPXTG cell wall anchor domain-containing protein [Pseudoflavonifractor capillosus]MBM6693449.1 FIVAR domain-containing protein [Pseudoflavonifractor capillosus]
MLEQLVAKAEAMVAEQDKYVQTDWQQLVDALAQARELLEDSGNALAGDVGEASEALLNAILAQRYKANKENLEDILNQAQAVDLSGYTAQSVAVFQAALAEAQAVMADETLSVEDQDAVDAAVEALASAMNGLTAETTPQPTQTPEASQTPEATQKPVVSEKPETNVPQTGDASQLAAMVGVLMSSATALGGVAIARKRRNG